MMGCWQLETPEEWKVRANSGSLRDTQEIREDGQKSWQRPRKSEWFPRQVALPVLQIRKWREWKADCTTCVCGCLSVHLSVCLSIHPISSALHLRVVMYVLHLFILLCLKPAYEYQHSYSDQDDGRALFQGDKVEGGRTGHCWLN